MADGGGRARGAAFGELRRWTQSRHLGYWGRRALAFELVWRLAWSLVLIPVGYLLVNWYVDAHLTSPEMTNIGVLIDFLNPLGIAVLVAMALIATVATVYELNVLTLYAVRIADQTPPTPSSPYREAFCRLSNRCTPPRYWLSPSMCY